MYLQRNFYTYNVKHRKDHQWVKEDSEMIEQQFKIAAYTPYKSVYASAMKRLEQHVPSGRVYCESTPPSRWSQAYIPFATYDTLTDNAVGALT